MFGISGVDGNMTELAFAKTDIGLHPANKETEEFVHRMKFGEQIHADFKKRRNVKFHRKGFALLNYLFEIWEPAEINNQYGTPEKNFDQFRKDLTILAGFYEQHYRLDGSIRIEAKSISFSSMSEEDFEKWYSAIIDVGLKHIVKGDRAEVDRVVNELIGGFG
jgi:hypothetical protein